MLNDVALGPDGTLRVTDTGIIMSPKACCTRAARRSSPSDRGMRSPSWPKGAALSEPNGITWDAAGKRWVVVGFASFASQVYALAGVDARRRIVAVPISVMGKVQFLRLPHAE